jgi:hypothetical protein
VAGTAEEAATAAGAVVPGEAVVGVTGAVAEVAGVAIATERSRSAPSSLRLTDRTAVGVPRG